MSVRDLFRILIKLFGVYSSIIAFFRITGQSLTSISFSSSPILVLLWVLFVFVIIFVFYSFLIFKTDFIIDKLRLDKGFDDNKIFINGITNQNIIKLAIILIGGFLLIENIPSFLGHSILEVQSHYNDKDYFRIENYPFYFQWLTEIISIIIGFLFVIRYKSLCNFFNKNNQ